MQSARLQPADAGQGEAEAEGKTEIWVRALTQIEASVIFCILVLIGMMWKEWLDHRK